jgi:hypothetical protein
MTKVVPVLGFVGLFALAGSGAGGDPVVAEAQALVAMAKLIRQDKAVQRWREIPWYTDVNEGIMAARAEKRPLLLWVTGDDPLGRC